MSKTGKKYIYQRTNGKFYVQIKNGTVNYTSKEFEDLTDAVKDRDQMLKQSQKEDSLNYKTFRGESFYKKGTKIGELTIGDHFQKKKKNSKKTYYHCTCSCGRAVDVSHASLKDGNTTTCGCSKKAYNVKKYKNNTTGVKGVLFAKDRQKYRAEIHHNKKRYHLGYFDKLEDAAEVRREAEEILRSGKELVLERKRT